jgi:hypothetical protein
LKHKLFLRRYFLFNIDDGSVQNAKVFFFMALHAHPIKDGHPRSVSPASTDVSHPTWNQYRKAKYTLGVSIFRGHPCAVNRQLREVILNCNEYHQQLLNLLGERYIHLYANSG